MLYQSTLHKYQKAYQQLHMIYSDETLMMILFAASEYISDVGLHNLGDIVLNDVLLCPQWFFTKHVYTCIMCAGRLFVCCRCTIGLLFNYDLIFLAYSCSVFVRVFCGLVFIVWVRCNSSIHKHIICVLHPFCFFLVNVISKMLRVIVFCFEVSYCIRLQ